MLVAVYGAGSTTTANNDGQRAGQWPLILRRKGAMSAEHRDSSKQLEHNIHIPCSVPIVDWTCIAFCIPLKVMRKFYHTCIYSS